MKVPLVSLDRMRFPYPVYPIGLDLVAGALRLHARGRVGPLWEMLAA